MKNPLSWLRRKPKVEPALQPPPKLTLDEEQAREAKGEHPGEQERKRDEGEEPPPNIQH